MMLTVTIIFVVLLLIVAYAILASMAKKLLTPYKLSDYHFVDADGNKIERTSTILQEPSLHVSVVIPAYNEQDRITYMLSETNKYLASRKEQDPNYTYEMIVIDDGSKDQTTKVVQKFMREQDKEGVVRLLPLVHNRGKGFAVKQGVIRARGKYILMADADAATDPKDLGPVEQKLTVDNRGYGISIGSRAHMAEGVTRERKWYRNILMYGFHFLVAYVGGIHDIKDTQCGFKLFTRASAREIFLNLHIDRWCFDIDMLRIAKYFQMPTAEVPVNWRDVEGSKMNIRGVVNMGIDLLLIRIYYTLSLWTIREKPSLRE
jgi:dolichyl-phosphate beta-glucosyltransferase